MSIEIENLSLRYVIADGKEITALDDISLSIKDREFVGIMGHTGCGKSTLIQVIAGLIEPDAGKIKIDGKEINAPDFDKSMLRQKIGVVFQYPECQLFESTVAKDAAFGLKYLGLSKKEIKERVQQALEMMGFSYEFIKDHSPLSLSGGEKRRAAIAGVLAVKPQILILDEPLAGLDPYGRESFLKLLLKLNREEGTTILMISHNSEALCACADRILVLEKGRISMDAAPKEIFRLQKQKPSESMIKNRYHEIAVRLARKQIPVNEEIVTYEELLQAAVSYGKEEKKP